MSVGWPAMQSKRMLLKTIYRSEELALNHNLTLNRFVAPVRLTLAAITSQQGTKPRSE